MSRIARLRLYGDEPEMPQLEEDAYLVHYLLEMGPLVNSNPVGHSDIRAWQDNIGVDLRPWEVRMIRALSIDYFNESHNATDPYCPSPWLPEGTEPMSQTKAALRRLG